MILPDVNVLVYAYRREADDHLAYHEWLQNVLNHSEEIALVDALRVNQRRRHHRKLRLGELETLSNHKMAGTRPSS